MRRLSNVGNIGGTYLSPILNTPQAVIGAIGKISKLPRYASTLPGHAGAGDAIIPAHVLTVSWVADHRIVDGATLARFSNAWKGFLETPLTMLAELR
jgi:2-oxoisovalerate dehydrogenase E2 component (dihydrolipoyl transacylase)